MFPKAFYKINIIKPLYETSDGYVVGIWDDRIHDAIKFRQPMLIEIKGIVKMFSPKWIKKNCKTIQKVYRRENEPMIEYLVFIPRPKKKSEDEILEEMSQQGVFG